MAENLHISFNAARKKRLFVVTNTDAQTLVSLTHKPLVSRELRQPLSQVTFRKIIPKEKQFAITS